MSANPLVQDAAARMREAGIIDVEFLRGRYDPQHFGNAEAVFRVGKLVVRFVRDRGQDFVDLASTAMPDKFYQFDDIDVAMGWRSVQEVVSKREPEGLSSVMDRLARNRGQLENAFSEEQESLTRSQVEDAARLRGDALFGRLNR